MTQTTRTTIATPHASRYLQQLCKHWSHKAKADFTPAAGTVTFETWQVAMQATDGALDVTVTVQNADEMARMQDVVTSHLQRFATQETLSAAWAA